MSTTNAKHTLEHPVTLAPLYRSEYRDDITKARDAKGRRVSTEALVDGLAESRARIAELEAALAAVTAQRDQCSEALEQLISQLEPVAVDVHEVAAIEDARAALRACEAEGGAE